MYLKTVAYYQGEYRLVPIDKHGRMRPIVWQTWFPDGPSLEDERRERERNEKERRRMHKEIERLSRKLEEREQD